MRITEEQRRIILEAVKKSDPNARVILFGSRVNDAQRGGDIDLFVVSDQISFRDELSIKRDILDQIGWQKMDLIVKRSDQLQSGIARIVHDKGIEL